MLTIACLLPTVGAVRNWLNKNKTWGNTNVVDLFPPAGFSWIRVSSALFPGDDSHCRGPWPNLEMQIMQFCLQEYWELQLLARHMCALGL